MSNKITRKMIVDEMRKAGIPVSDELPEEKKIPPHLMPKMLRALDMWLKWGAEQAAKEETLQEQTGVGETDQKPKAN